MKLLDSGVARELKLHLSLDSGDLLLLGYGKKTDVVSDNIILHMPIVFNILYSSAFLARTDGKSSSRILREPGNTRSCREALFDCAKFLLGG